MFGYRGSIRSITEAARSISVGFPMSARSMILLGHKSTTHSTRPTMSPTRWSSCSLPMNAQDAELVIAHTSSGSKELAAYTAEPASGERLSWPRLGIELHITCSPNLQITPAQVALGRSVGLHATQSGPQVPASAVRRLPSREDPSGNVSIDLLDRLDPCNLLVIVRAMRGGRIGNKSRAMSSQNVEQHGNDGIDACPFHP